MRCPLTSNVMLVVGVTTPVDGVGVDPFSGVKPAATGTPAVAETDPCVSSDAAEGDMCTCFDSFRSSPQISE